MFVFGLWFDYCGLLTSLIWGVWLLLNLFVSVLRMLGGRVWGLVWWVLGGFCLGLFISWCFYSFRWLLMFVIMVGWVLHGGF